MGYKKIVLSLGIVLLLVPSVYLNTAAFVGRGHCNTMGAFVCNKGGGTRRPRPTPRPTAKPKPTARPKCDPTYAPPRITSGPVFTPPYPLTIGQDPDQLGVDITLTARGGRKTNNCWHGENRARIRSFSVLDASLAPSSVAWISGELALRYPGAHLKDSYPIYPAFSQSGLLAGNGYASLTFHIDPLDPGYYNTRVQICQTGNDQCVIQTVQVPVYLLESTIIR